MNANLTQLKEQVLFQNSLGSLDWADELYGAVPF